MSTAWYRMVQIVYKYNYREVVYLQYCEFPQKLIVLVRQETKNDKTKCVFHSSNDTLSFVFHIHIVTNVHYI